MEAAEQHEGPTPVRRAAPLTRPERLRVAYAALVPVLVTFVLLFPVVLVTTVTAGEAAVAAIVLGGLVGLLVGSIAAERLQAHRCPRCHERPAAGTAVCDRCGYDLQARPRFACAERHLVYLDTAGDGRCRCGRPLAALPTTRGVRAQVVATVRITGLLVGFLVVTGLILNLLSGRL